MSILASITEFTLKNPNYKEISHKPISERLGLIKEASSSKAELNIIKTPPKFVDQKTATKFKENMTPTQV